LHQHVKGCPCCVGPSDQAQNRSKLLRCLTEDDIGRDAVTALTTWSTVADVKGVLGLPVTGRHSTRRARAERARPCTDEAIAIAESA
jgi:hypothetical protein